MINESVLSVGLFLESTCTCKHEMYAPYAHDCRASAEVGEVAVEAIARTSVSIYSSMCKKKKSTRKNVAHAGIVNTVSAQRKHKARLTGWKPPPELTLGPHLTHTCTCTPKISAIDTSISTHLEKIQG